MSNKKKKNADKNMLIFFKVKFGKSIALELAPYFMYGVSWCFTVNI